MECIVGRRHNRMKYWIPLFSHTGTEVAAVVRLIQDLTIPFAIFSNQTEYSKVDLNIASLTEFLPHPDIMEEIMNIAKSTDKEIVITLHGYMRIIPPEIIDLPNVSIYNVHPGDIVKYPELRGKDPQSKALDLRLNTTGVVIHRVDEGIDTGQVISREVIAINEHSLDSLIYELRLLSISMWCGFLRNILDG